MRQTLHVACWALLACASSAPAATITLDFNSLPSAQGWTYVAGGSSPVTEGTAFSLSSNTLALNGVGLGATAPHYRTLTGIDPVNAFHLTFTARVTADENLGSAAQGFYVSLVAGGRRFNVALTPTAIYDTNLGAPMVGGLDNTVFHDYRLEGDPGSGLWDLYVDNALVGSGSAQLAATDAIRIGDGTSFHNANAELTAFTYTTNPVPEPGSLALLFALGAGLLTLRRRTV